MTEFKTPPHRWLESGGVIPVHLSARGIEYAQEVCNQLPRDNLILKPGVQLTTDLEGRDLMVYGSTTIVLSNPITEGFWRFTKAFLLRKHVVFKASVDIYTFVSRVFVNGNRTPLGLCQKIVERAFREDTQWECSFFSPLPLYPLIPKSLWQLFEEKFSVVDSEGRCVGCYGPLEEREEFLATLQERLSACRNSYE